MIFTEEDSERNAELKKNLSVPPLNFDEETLKEINNNFKNGRLEKVREISSLPISHIVITHSHPDHFFGAEAFVNIGDFCITYVNALKPNLFFCKLSITIQEFFDSNIFAQIACSLPPLPITPIIIYI